MWVMLFLLLPIAALSGWWIGRKEWRVKSKTAHFSKDIYSGIEFLVQERPDIPVDEFIKNMSVNDDTIETHLSIGNLYRRRGEVDRAIKIHQNLIARSNITKSQRGYVLLELGRDYLSAGVLDRAEHLFHEVVKMGEQMVPSLQHLQDIYQQEKDWQQAISVAQTLEVHANISMVQAVAHYNCELAEHAKNTGDVQLSTYHIRKALSINRDCVRASLLQGDLDLSLGKFKTALRSYKRVRQQDPRYISECISPIAICYQRIGNQNLFEQFLYSCLSENPGYPVVMALAERLRERSGDASALEFVRKQLSEQPSLRGLLSLMVLSLPKIEHQAKEHWLVLKDLVQSMAVKHPHYRCVSCGFKSKSLIWLCPSCKEWDVVLPLASIDV